MIKQYFFPFLLFLASSNFAMEIEPSQPNSLETQIKTLIDAEQSKDKAYEQLGVIAQENEKKVSELHDLFEYYWEQKHGYHGNDEYLTKKLPQDVLGLIVKQLTLPDDSQKLTIHKGIRTIQPCTLVNKAMSVTIPYLFVRYVMRFQYDIKDREVLVPRDAIRINSIHWIQEWLASNPSIESIIKGSSSSNLLMFSVAHARPKIVQLLKNYVLSFALYSENGSLAERAFTSNPDLFKELIDLFEGTKEALDETLMKKVIHKIPNVSDSFFIEYLCKTWPFQWTFSSLYALKVALPEKSLNLLKSKGVFESVNSNILLEVLKTLEQIILPKDQYVVGADMPMDLKSLLLFFVNDIDFSSIYLHCINRILLSDQELQSVSPKSHQWYIDLMLCLMKQDKGQLYTIAHFAKSLYVSQLYTLANHDVPEQAKLNARKILQKWKDELEKWKNELEILSRMNNLTLKKQL